VQDLWPVRETLAAFLPKVKRALLGNHVDRIAFVGIQTWLLPSLAENGFEQIETVVTLQKTDGVVPCHGNQRVHVRPAQWTDLGPAIEIDRRAFIPLWQNTERMLAHQLPKSDYSVVAELEQRVVGYALASLSGRHGHLTRLAVDPRLHGQQIGTRLLAESITYLRNQGVYGITLNTQQSNVRSLRLYSRFGFRVLGQEAQVWMARV
jgi:ribosomal-protein-alanine N-acetyltransferase